MDIRYKAARARRWSRRIGLWNALCFELQHTARRQVVPLYHGGLKRWFYLRHGSSDLSVFEHVFIGDEFDVPLDDPALIIDGGANCGMSTVYFAMRYPKARIIAIEPSEENCAMARRNLAGLNAEVRQTALWSHPTRLRIQNADAAYWALRCTEAEADSTATFAAVDVTEVLDGRDCDLLKLDIEGAEVEVFSDPKWLQHVKAIVVEVHGADAEAAVRAACKGWLIDQTGEKLFLRRPAA